METGTPNFKPKNPMDPGAEAQERDAQKIAKARATIAALEAPESAAQKEREGHRMPSDVTLFIFSTPPTGPVDLTNPRTIASYLGGGFLVQFNPTAPLSPNEWPIPPGLLNIDATPSPHLQAGPGIKWRNWGETPIDGAGWGDGGLGRARYELSRVEKAAAYRNKRRSEFAQECQAKIEAAAALEGITVLAYMQRMKQLARR